MKGLIIKDIKLLKNMLLFLGIFAGVAILMLIKGSNLIFPCTILALITSYAAIATISYDEYDSGYATIFTLPITRKEYVLEKYLLALSLATTAFFLLAICGMIIMSFKGQKLDFIFEQFYFALVMLPIIIIFEALILPIKLRFSAEKSTIILFVTLGTFLFFGRLFFAQIAVLDLSFVVPESVSPLLLVGLYVLSIILLLLSLMISIKIIKGREF